MSSFLTAAGEYVHQIGSGVRTIVAKLCHRFQEAPRLATLRKASGGLASPRLFSTELRVEFLVGLGDPSLCERGLEP
jgi:hypothetical protein